MVDISLVEQMLPQCLHCCFATRQDILIHEYVKFIKGYVWYRDSGIPCRDTPEIETMSWIIIKKKVNKSH